MTYNADESPIIRERFPFLVADGMEVEISSLKFKVILPNHGNNATSHNACKSEYFKELKEEVVDLSTLFLYSAPQSRQLALGNPTGQIFQRPAYTRRCSWSQGAVVIVRNVTNGAKFARKTLTNATVDQYKEA